MGADWAVRYARTSDGIDVAYAITGDGPRDVVLIHGFTTHLDFVGDSVWHSYWTRRLGERFRVIQFNKRGTGLSDRSLGLGSIEDRTRDVLAVMDAAGSPRASIVGVSEGGPIGLTFAATYPDRVDKLVIYGSYARMIWAPDYPVGIAPERAEQFMAWVQKAWGRGEVFATTLITHAPDPAAAIRAMAKFERNACTPQMAGEIMRRNTEVDVRALLPGIAAPTLVVHTSGDPVVPIGCGRYLANNIPGAELAEEAGDYHCTWLPREFQPLMDRTMGFLGDEVPEARRVEAPTRSVATILFTDIVGSTDRAVTMGDERWRRLLEQHDQHALESTRSCGGTVVKSTGDGMLALFDGPSRAIEAVGKLHQCLAPLGVQLRAGIHTGELERTKGDVAGIGVHIAARIMALAAPDEVLVSRTVKDLAAGSGFVFSGRGTEVLRGVPDTWDLYAVTGSSAGR